MEAMKVKCSDETPVTVTVKMVRAEAGHQPRELKNIVLQHFCDMNEDPRGHPKKDKIRLATGTMLLKKFVKGKNTADHFEEGNPGIPWSWITMLNSMDDHTLESIVGPGIEELDHFLPEKSSQHRGPRGAHQQDDCNYYIAQGLLSLEGF